jgi:hypothetical protein
MNLYTALNGKEAKQAILNDVARALENDSEFREHLTFPRVSWTFKLEMRIYPRTPEEKIVETAGEMVQVARDTDINSPTYNQLMPVATIDSTHVKSVHTSVQEAVAPDALREQHDLVVNQAKSGGIRIARSVEVGKAALSPVTSPGLNR